MIGIRVGGKGGRARDGRGPGGGSGSGSLVGPDGEPLFVAGVSNLLFAANSSNYSTATAASTTPVTGGGIRFIPGSVLTSNDSSQLDTSENIITTGKGGSGLALVNHYRDYDGGFSQPGPEWYLANVASQAASKTIYLRAYHRIDGSGTTDIHAVKWCHILPAGVSGGHQAQFSTHDESPYSGTDPWHTFWQVYSDGFTDDGSVTGNGTYPLSHDQATQQFEPFFEQMLGDSTWHRFTYAYRSHSAAGVYDGFQRMWIDGVKILECSNAFVGVTPPAKTSFLVNAGGYKHWCSQDIVQNMLVNKATDPAALCFFGGPASSHAFTAWDQLTNLGNGDATNLDTFAAWTD